MKNVLRVACCVLTLGLLAACWQAELEPLRIGAAPWRAGEAHLFGVTALDGNYAGTARFEVREGNSAGNNSAPADWLIRRTTDAQGNLEVFDVTLDSERLRPVQSSWVLTNSTGIESIQTVIQDGLASMTLTSTQSQIHTEQRTLSSDTYDSYTINLLLRTLPLTEGYVAQLNIFTSLTGVSERATVSIGGLEQIGVPAGTYKTWKIDVLVGQSESNVWIGAESPFPLVKYMDARNGATYELIEFLP